jgi:hypothetical protein
MLNLPVLISTVPSSLGWKAAAGLKAIPVVSLMDGCWPAAKEATQSKKHADKKALRSKKYIPGFIVNIP